IGNTLLDLLRRRALGLRVGAGTVIFRPGHDRVELPEAGTLGSTLRFSLRRARPRTAPEAFEPMLDFSTPTQPPQEQEPPHRRGTPIRRQPQTSVLDAEVPDFHLDAAAVAVAQAADDADEAAGNSRSTDDFRRAASQLFAGEDEEEAETDVPRSRSLDNIERAERRQRRTLVLLLVFLLLAVCCAVAGIWWFFRNDLGVRPSPKSYGTAAFDETAEKYMGRAMEKYPGVVGYLAFPGQNGSFVYPQGAAAQDGSPLVTFAGDNYLAAAMPSNTVLQCEGDTLASFATMDTVQENSGFTLYMPGEVYRFKILAVYYSDPAEQDGFTGGAADLSAYYDYIAFVTGVKARSLFDTAIEVGDNARFLTLTSASAEQDIEICVTGRLVEADESAQLVPSAIQQSVDPLLTNAQYRREGREAPALLSLLSTQLGWYANQNVPAAEPVQEPSTSGSSDEVGDLSGQIDALDEKTQALLASADQLLAGLTDVAGSAGAVESDLNQGAEGSLPEQIVTIDQIATPAPTEAPTQAPTQAPSGDSTASPDATPAPTQAPTQAPAPAAETIKVTMNGVAQEMDLVQCLAMVAQNELGPNAPAEAYKAQCVATHCWIISQSGYPSVLGSTPGAAALAAAQEVSRVLVTYNGQVCFTPYFASASTGTASSKDVWGGERAWLQAVDSPYDQQVATHWNTNGATSGTARFARQTLQDRIQEKLGIDLSGVDPNQWFNIVSANPYGWVVRIQIGPDSANTYSGTWFRETLLAGQSVDGRSLRSQCFTVSYDAGLDCFLFDVYGYGHGCGMSQWGAIGYARNGWDYQSILTHYFTGTTITTY
ncbi:MAG: SpoIID/LytB domain-containing protein, partial [Gemmiger sp.]